MDAPPLADQLFARLIDCYNAGDNSPAELLACEGLSKYLFSFFLPATDTEATPEAARFIPVLQYIDTHFNQHIANTDLSAIMYLSPTYFSNLFTKQFGITPQQYIQQKRMNSAAIMLFESEAYFNRSFHKFMGISPGKYRKLAGTINGSSKN